MIKALFQTIGEPLLDLPPEVLGAKVKVGRPVGGARCDAQARCEPQLSRLRDVETRMPASQFTLGRGMGGARRGTDLFSDSGTPVFLLSRDLETKLLGRRFHSDNSWGIL